MYQNLKFQNFFTLEYFKLSTCWAQSDVFDVKSKDFSKIRQIRLFRQGISENLECTAKNSYSRLMKTSGLFTRKLHTVDMAIKKSEKIVKNPVIST